MSQINKKLCIVLPQHWEVRMGGSEYQIKCLLESGLLQRHFDISIASRRVDNTHIPNGYRSVSISKPFVLQRYGLVFDTPFLWRKLRQISPDVIYQNIGTSYAGIATCFSRRAGCKMVLHIASDNDIVPYKGTKWISSVIPRVEKGAFDFAIRNADILIAQTYHQKNLIWQHYGRKVDAVIPNFQPLPKEEITKNLPVKVLWVANIKPLKQPELFIRLAEDLSNTRLQAKFIMVGTPDNDSEWQNVLEQRINRVENLTYLGGRTIDEVGELFARSHILVNTSKFEGFSNTFIQGWMRQVPVVSLNSNPDSLLNGEELGFCSGSYERLRDDVMRLIENHSLREKMGLEAQAFALEHYSMENAKKITRVLVDDQNCFQSF